MKYILTFVVLTLFCFLCQKVKVVSSKFEQDTVCISDYKQRPDTTICEVIYLRSPLSVKVVLGDIMTSIDRDKDFPDLHFLSKYQDEYLKVTVFPGDEANTISQFQVGYTSNINAIDLENLSSLGFESFETESGVRLGMLLSSIISLKGTNYKEENIGSMRILRYEVINQESNFLKRYNMSVYFLEYHFEGDLLNMYRFGFEYP